MDNLNPGESLVPGQSLTSINGYHVFILQGDGNLVLYSLGRPVWATMTNGQQVERLVMQDDGNLVLYATDGRALWNTQTAGNGGSSFVVQGDRNAVVYSQDGNPLWATNTHTALEIWDRTEFAVSPALVEQIKADATIGPIFMFFVEVTTGVTASGFLVFLGALVVVAIIVEFANGRPPFGPNNDLVIMGKQIENDAREAGREVSDWAKKQGGEISKTLKKLYKPF